MNKNTKNVVHYYKTLESKLGYALFTWDTKHFGYYPSGKTDIPEKEAQVLMMDQVAKKLKLKKGDFVLDAGCGKGTTTCYFASRYGCKVVGIDIVKFELEKAKNRAKKLNLEDKVSFLMKNYSDTKFPSSYFDKIFTLETLVHSPDIKCTLKELYRILKPGGKIALFEYSRSLDQDFNKKEIQTLDLINRWSAMAGFQNMYHGVLEKLLQKVGFKDIYQEDISYYVAPSLKKFYKFAKIVYPLIKLLKLQGYFINATAAVEFYRIGLKGLIKYRTYIAKK